MKQQAESWKDQMIDEIDSPDFNWLDFQPIEAKEGMMIHYTPRWPLMLHYICAMICFGMSAVYHLFNSHSHEMMRFWIRFDYAGICFMIAGSTTPPVYYSFGCDELQDWRWFYLGLIYAVNFITMVTMMIPYFDRDDMQSLRSIMFVSTAGFAVFPVCHIVYHVDPEFLPRFYLEPWLLGAAMYVTGAIFYAFKYPECCSKQGTFDIYGSSHQIMHIMIVSAALTHYYGAIQVFHDRQLYSCPLKHV